MGRSPCCDETGLKKGPWTPEEDEKLVDSINQHGLGSWRGLPKRAGLNRCGKSCRLRWTNYLRPDIKRGKFTEQEDQLIINLHSVLGNKWSKIAGHLEGRTDNEIKNYWNTHLRKKLLHKGIDPNTHKPISDPNLLANLSHLLSSSNFGNLMSPNLGDAFRPQLDATQLVVKLKLLQSIMQVINTTPLVPNIPPSNLLGLGPHTSNISQFEGFSYPTTQVPFSNFTPQVNTNLPVPSSSFQPEFFDDVDFTSFLNDEVHAQTESASLPPLASSSSLQSSPVTRQGSENGQEYPSTNPSSSNIFETWEKFLVDDDDDGGGEVYGPWRDILEKL